MQTEIFELFAQVKSPVERAQERPGDRPRPRQAIGRAPRGRRFAEGARAEPGKHVPGSTADRQL